MHGTTVSLTRESNLWNVRLEFYTAVVPLSADDDTFNCPCFDNLIRALIAHKSRRLLVRTGNTAVTTTKQDHCVSPHFTNTQFAYHDEQPCFGPSGLSITSYFDAPASSTPTYWDGLLSNIVSQRIVLAPVLSSRQYNQKIQTINVNARNYTRASINLPYDYSLTSGESIRSLVDSSCGMELLETPEHWSNLLLQSDPSSALRTGWYLDVFAGDNSTTSNIQQYHVVIGMQYNVPFVAQPSLAHIFKMSDQSTKALAQRLQLPIHIYLVQQQHQQRGLKDQTNFDMDGTNTLKHLTIFDSSKSDILEPLLDATQHDTTAHSPILWSINSHFYKSFGINNDGSIQIVLANNHPVCTSIVTLQQHLPAYLRPKFTTLKIFIDNDNHSITHLDWHAILFQNDGSIDLEWRVDIPAQSKLILEFDYQSAFLPFESFPTDANRGFELAPARAHFLLHESCQYLQIAPATLYSNSHIVLTPLPDRSMPFNILSLVCTFYAFFIGSIIASITRKSPQNIKYKLDPSLKPPSLRSKIKAKLSKLRPSLTTK